MQNRLPQQSKRPRFCQMNPDGDDSLSSEDQRRGMFLSILNNPAWIWMAIIDN